MVYYSVGPGVLANQIASLPFCVDFDDVSNERHSKSIERVQRRATRLVFKQNTLNYSERMRFLHLLSLQFRRIRGDLIQTIKS